MTASDSENIARAVAPVYGCVLVGFAFPRRRQYQKTLRHARVLCLECAGEISWHFKNRLQERWLSSPARRAVWDAVLRVCWAKLERRSFARAVVFGDSSRLRDVRKQS